MASDRDLTLRARSGAPVSMAMKIATLASRREIEGFEAGLAVFGTALSDEDRAALDAIKAKVRR